MFVAAIKRPKITLFKIFLYTYNIRRSTVHESVWHNNWFFVFILFVYNLSLFHFKFIKENPFKLVVCSYYVVDLWNYFERIRHKEISGMNTLSSFLKAFLDGMRNFGRNIIALINFILLLIVYIFGLGLTSFIAKLFFKKIFLETKPSKDKSTYWSELPFNCEEDSYYRQF